MLAETLNNSQHSTRLIAEIQSFTAITSLNSINQIIFVMVKCCDLFGVGTVFFNIIWTSFGFEGDNL
jgi:hypothetical protein